MSEDFESTYNKILRAQMAKERKKRVKPEKKLDMGDTRFGRALANGTTPPKPEAEPIKARRTVHEHKASPGAVKGRGKFGWVRK